MEMVIKYKLLFVILVAIDRSGLEVIEGASEAPLPLPP